VVDDLRVLFSGRVDGLKSYQVPEVLQHLGGARFEESAKLHISQQFYPGPGPIKGFSDLNSPKGPRFWGEPLQKVGALPFEPGEEDLRQVFGPPRPVPPPAEVLDVDVQDPALPDDQLQPPGAEVDLVPFRKLERDLKEGVGLKPHPAVQ